MQSLVLFPIWHHISKSKANLTSKVQGKEGIGESIILPDSTLQRFGFLSLIPVNLNSVPMFLASHLSLLSPLVYFLLTFKLSQKLLVHFLQRWDPVKHLPVLDPWLPVSGSHYQCNPETCCMVCALLCCPPTDTEVIQVSSEKSMACKCENLSSCLKEASSTSPWSGGLQQTPTTSFTLACLLNLTHKFWTGSSSISKQRSTHLWPHLPPGHWNYSGAADLQQGQELISSASAHQLPAFLVLRVSISRSHKHRHCPHLLW